MALDIKTVPKDVAITAENVAYIADRAQHLLTALQARIDSLREHVEVRRKALLQEASDIIVGSAPDNRANARQYSKHAMATKFAQYMRNLVSSSHTSRHELLEPLKALRDNAEFLMQLFATPAQALGRVGLGDTKRTQLQLQLTGAGNVELQSAAAVAISTGDVVLAAAIVTVIDRLPRSDRPFSVADFATRMWGEQHSEVVTKLKIAIHCYKLAEIADKQFVTGEVNQVSRISALLDQREIERETDRTGDAA